MKVVVINGVPRAGKDLFVSYCQEILGENFCKNISTVDKVKEVAKYIGWDGTKDNKSRKFLSDLKDLLTEAYDIPFQDACTEIRKFAIALRRYEEDIRERGVIFVHCREPKEIQRFKNEFKAETVLVRRDAAEEALVSNHADSEVFQYEYNTWIENNGTREELRSAAETFLREVLKIID